MNSGVESQGGQWRYFCPYVGHGTWSVTGFQNCFCYWARPTINPAVCIELQKKKNKTKQNYGAHCHLGASNYIPKLLKHHPLVSDFISQFHETLDFVFDLHFENFNFIISINSMLGNRFQKIRKQ